MSTLTAGFCSADDLCDMLVFDSETIMWVIYKASLRLVASLTSRSAERLPFRGVSDENNVLYQYHPLWKRLSGKHWDVRSSHCCPKRAMLPGKRQGDSCSLKETSDRWLEHSYYKTKKDNASKRSQTATAPLNEKTTFPRRLDSPVATAKQYLTYPLANLIAV